MPFEMTRLSLRMRKRLPPRYRLSPTDVPMIPPPAEYLGATLDTIRETLAHVKPGKNGIMTWIATKVDDEVRINYAYVHKIGDNITIGAWLGKTWGKPLEAGVFGSIDF